ncbi:MAG: hypothetical protein JO364_10400 [Pseudonocardiales bacterium]|nr:hypothetical protein [Pseudonocardiales bacterium]MBV9030693.1 hypothetical protein [Pseudonocardiales bacterium]
MPYLISVSAAAAGVVVLVRLGGSARRLAGTVHCGRAHFVDRIGLLAARVTTVRRELDQRRHRNGGSTHPTPAA